MMTSDSIGGYNYHDDDFNASHALLLPSILRVLGTPDRSVRVFDLGCGNGALAGELDRLGWTVTGIDPSTEGIAYAQANRSHLDLHCASAYDDLAARFGQFPFVVSMEVVQHVYAPRDWARTLFNLLEPGGTAVISTPYHGYIKNLAMALAGRMDAHFTALWDHGHIKFWSIKTLTALLDEAGFVNIGFDRVGRIPALAMSMVATVRRPASATG